MFDLAVVGAGLAGLKLTQHVLQKDLRLRVVCLEAKDEACAVA
jgi:flavin-dependent dehydrogenase